MTLVFSSDSGNHRSDVQRPALKLNVDTSRIYFSLQKAETRKTRSRGRMFKFFLYCGVDSPFLGVEVHFFFHPV
jgi:hypothetical protein